MHKAGFVSFIGVPNVGKSTLMNSLLGQPLSVVNSKAQTTRHRIHGIINEENFQLILSDLPGIMTPHYTLHKAMLKAVDDAIDDSDMLVIVSDPQDEPLPAGYLQKIVQSQLPCFVVINKMDTSNTEQIIMLVNEWKERIPGADIFPVSALHGFGVGELLQALVEKLPQHPPFYPKDQLTDRNERFFVAEIIRGQILQHYHQEVPYHVEVAIESFREEENIVKIEAVIYTARESQKKILIGAKGQAIKNLGIQSRKLIEAFLGQRIFLGLSVKVSENWRDDEKKLQRFGYDL